ncbi:MAG: RidA family protein [Salinivirgaceae bacterium]|jgi:2-iminobutanoate/2-iminopropanoate deaminase|nr:RidA family protein [Salinivirgaceae bacterium]
MKKIISTDKAPKAIGSYSQAVYNAGHLYISGQLPINPETGKMPDGIVAQTEQALKNVKAILEEANFTLNDVVKSTVLLKSIADFGDMNNVYAQYYTSKPPARAAYEVANLPLGALIEIETIAIRACN